jgi:hypothetical protein
VTGSGAGLTVPAAGGGTVIFNVQDLNGNSMAAGTGVSITSGSTTDLTATQVGATAVPCATDFGPTAGVPGGQDYAVNLAPNTAGSTTLTVSVASPNGTISYLIVPVTVQ